MKKVLNIFIVVLSVIMSSQSTWASDYYGEPKSVLDSTDICIKPFIDSDYNPVLLYGGRWDFDAVPELTTVEVGLFERWSIKQTSIPCEGLPFADFNLAVTSGGAALSSVEMKKIIPVRVIVCEEGIPVGYRDKLYSVVLEYVNAEMKYVREKFFSLSSNQIQRSILSKDAVMNEGQHTALHKIKENCRMSFIEFMNVAGQNIVNTNQYLITKVDTRGFFHYYNVYDISDYSKVNKSEIRVRWRTQNQNYGEPKIRILVNRFILSVAEGEGRSEYILYNAFGIDGKTLGNIGLHKSVDCVPLVSEGANEAYLEFYQSGVARRDGFVMALTLAEDEVN